MVSNYFTETTFGCFLQVFGIAMGSNLSKAAANLAAWFFETKTLATLDVTKLFYSRYVVDIFWLGLGLLPPVSLYPPNLKIIWSPPTKSVDYLHLHIELRESSVYYRVHQKELNTYPYPLESSNLVTASKSGFIHGECIRYLRLSSEESDYKDMLYKFALCLLNCGYLPSTYRRIFKRVKWEDRTYHRQLRPRRIGIPLIFRMRYMGNDREGTFLLKCLVKYWDLLPNHFQQVCPFICWTTQRKLNLFATKADHQKIVDNNITYGLHPRKKIKFLPTPVGHIKN